LWLIMSGSPWIGFRRRRWSVSSSDWSRVELALWSGTSLDRFEHFRPRCGMACSPLDWFGNFSIIVVLAAGFEALNVSTWWDVMPHARKMIITALRAVVLPGRR
jgi:hypothetical protein